MIAALTVAAVVIAVWRVVVHTEHRQAQKVADELANLQPRHRLGIHDGSFVPHIFECACGHTKPCWDMDAALDEWNHHSMEANG